MKDYEFTVLSSSEEPYYFETEKSPYVLSCTECLRMDEFDVYLIERAAANSAKTEDLCNREPDCTITGTYVAGQSIDCFSDAEFLDACDEYSGDVLDAATHLQDFIGFPEEFFLLESITVNSKLGDSIISRILQELPQICYHTFFQLPTYILYYPESYAENNRHICDTGMPMEDSVLEANLKKEMKPFLKVGYKKMADTKYYYLICNYK